MVLAIAAIAGIAVYLLQSQPESVSPAEGMPRVSGDAATQADPFVSGSSSAKTSEASSGSPSSAATDEEVDPHKYIEDLPQVSVQLPIEPVPRSQANRKDGQAATAPEPGRSTMPGAGPGGAIPVPSGPVAGDPATEYVGEAPDLGGPQVVGLGPGGEPSGTTNIEPVDLGEPQDIAVEGGAEVDLGPAPEASDPGSMGPAPEDSGG